MQVESITETLNMKIPPINRNKNPANESTNPRDDWKKFLIQFRWQRQESLLSAIYNSLNFANKLEYGSLFKPGFCFFELPLVLFQLFIIEMGKVGHHEISAIESFSKFFIFNVCTVDCASTDNVGQSKYLRNFRINIWVGRQSGLKLAVNGLDQM
jgi:hypothetical protein